MAKKVNWTKIRNEYITGSISYQKLAQKYKVPLGTLVDRAQEEKWFSLKKETHKKAIAKSVDKISDLEAEKLARINTLADKLLEKLEKAVEELDFKTTEVIHRDGDKDNYTQTKELVAAPGGVVDQKALRNLTAALKDLKEVKGIQTELQKKEQEARIAILQKQATSDEKQDSIINVVMEGGVGEYGG